MTRALRADFKDVYRDVTVTRKTKADYKYCVVAFGLDNKTVLEARWSRQYKRGAREMMNQMEAKWFSTNQCRTIMLTAQIEEVQV